MYSRDETVAAITSFYKHLTKHPYLDESALLIPPPTGWTTIDETALRAIGKTETVIDLLRHLPYLNGKGSGHMIAYETIPVDFTVDATALIETIPEFPIPGHCVYITDGYGREGYQLIVDTELGTTTAFSITGYEFLSEAWEHYKDRPAIDEWRAHRTLPTTEFFAAWTQRYEKLVWFISPRPSYPGAGQLHSRAENWPHEEELCHRRMPTRWTPKLNDIEEYRTGWLKYSADIYNTYMRYGWGSDAFDKQACKVTLVKMERDYKKEERRLIKLNDSDYALFD